MFSMVKNWIAQFKRGRTTTNDGRPKALTTTNVIEKVCRIVLDDCRVTVGDLPEQVGISNNFDSIKKIFGQLGVALAQPEKKLNDFSISCHLLARFCRNANEFLHRFITANET